MIKNLTLIILLLTPTIGIIAQKSDTSVFANTFGIVYSDTTKDTPLVLKDPIISLKTHNINIGNTPQSDTPLKYDLYYSNTGTEPLLITKVRTSCSCTVAYYPKTPLPPGGSDKIVLELETKFTGTFRKVVAIYSNAANDYDSSINCSREIAKVSWRVIKKQAEKTTKKETH